MYVSPNFKSRKELVEAVKAGKHVTVFSPGPFPATNDGWNHVEGPHYPQPHKWYGTVRCEGGVVKEVGK